MANGDAMVKEYVTPTLEAGLSLVHGTEEAIKSMQPTMTMKLAFVSDPKSGHGAYCLCQAFTRYQPEKRQGTAWWCRVEEFWVRVPMVRGE